MQDAYEKALRDGLRSLGLSDPGSEEFRNFIFKAGDSFRAGLEKRDPPLDAAAREREREAFGAAVAAVVSECMGAQAERWAGDEQVSTQNESVAQPEADVETAATAGEAPAEAHEETDWFSEQAVKDHPVKARLVRLAACMLFLFLVAVLVLAIASPLVTPVMAWGEPVNILALTVGAAALAFMSALPTGSWREEGVGAALMFGLIFGVLSFSFHKVDVLRTWVEDDPSFLAMIADTATESYFTVADWVGIAEPEPGEPRLTTVERRQAFQQEVDSWLDK